MNSVKRGVGIPSDLYVWIRRLAAKVGVSPNRVMVRMLQIARMHDDLTGSPDQPSDCAHVLRTRSLVEATRGRTIMSRRRLIKLLGLRTARDKRFTGLVRDGVVEIQQSGFAGDSMHHEKLAKIRRDIRLAP